MLPVMSLLTSLTVSLAMTAQDPQPPADADEAARVGTVGDTTIYDFDDDDVQGEVLSPDGANVRSRSAIKHASLIEIRPHFIPELIKLARDL